jgi:pimeloyl-ACP methyl ester carboxylesterase
MEVLELIKQSVTEQIARSDVSGFPSYWAEVDGLKIHYKGLGEGPPVIFLHGGANDWHEWQKNIAYFAADFRVYALDLPSLGLSDTPDRPVSLLWFSSFVKDFMDSLGIADAHLVAHSIGGSIVLAFALAFPERLKKAILIDSTGFGQVSKRGRWLIFFTRGIKRLLGREKSPRYSNVHMEDWLLIAGLEEIKAPVLIVWGRRDPYLPLSQARLAQRVLPDCRLYVFGNCRHAPHRERADDFNRLACEFLKEGTSAHGDLLTQEAGQSAFS